MSLRVMVFTGSLKIQYLEAKQANKQCVNRGEPCPSNSRRIQLQSLLLNLHLPGKGVNIPLYSHTYCPFILIICAVIINL